MVLVVIVTWLASPVSSLLKETETSSPRTDAGNAFYRVFIHISAVGVGVDGTALEVGIKLYPEDYVE